MKALLADHYAPGSSCVQANLLADSAYTPGVQTPTGSKANSGSSCCFVAVLDKPPNRGGCTVQTPAPWDCVQGCARPQCCRQTTERGAPSRLRRPCSRHPVVERTPLRRAGACLGWPARQTSEPQRRKFDLRAARDSSCRLAGLGLYGTNPSQGDLKGWLPLRSLASSTLATTTVRKAASSPNHSGPIAAFAGDHRGQ